TQLPPALLKLPWIGEQLSDLRDRMAEDPRALSTQLHDWAERSSTVIAHVLEQVLGPRVHNYLHAIGPTVKAVVYGLVLAAVAQGVLAGIGYWAAGVGAPVFLAILTIVCGLLPF